MISGSVKNLDTVLNSIKRQIGSVADRVANKILREAKIHTPIDKGRARRGWRLKKSTSTARKEIRVTNRVPYIDLLERGRSKQRPRGIVRPTLAAFKRGGKI